MLRSILSMIFLLIQQHALLEECPGALGWYKIPPLEGLVEVGARGA
jgi:hypothetical protein